MAFLSLSVRQEGCEKKALALREWLGAIYDN